MLNESEINDLRKPALPARGFGRTCRRCFALLVIAGFLLLLLVAAGIIYLQTTGAPSFVRSRLETKLFQNGIQVRLGTIRLRGVNEFVASDLNYQTRKLPGHIRIKIPRLVVALDLSALLRLEISPRSVAFEHARVIRVLVQTNAPLSEFALDEATGQIALSKGKTPSLLSLKARCLGADLTVTGAITNLVGLQTWSQRVARHPSTNWEAQLDRFLIRLADLQLTSPSAVEVDFQWDGISPANFRLKSHLQSVRAKWLDNSIDGLQFTGVVEPAKGNVGEVQVNLRATSDRAAGQWGALQDVNVSAAVSGSLTNRALTAASGRGHAGRAQIQSMTNESVNLSAVLLPEARSPGRFRSDLMIEVDSVQTPWGGLVTNRAQVNLTHGRTFTDPWEMQYRTAARTITTSFGQAEQVQLTGRVAPRRDSPAKLQVDPVSGWWSKLEPFRLNWELRLERPRTPKVELASIALAGEWDSPTLVLSQVHTELEGDRGDGSARLNLATRELAAQAKLDLNVRKITPLLAEDLRRWLDQFRWNASPSISAEVKLVLPSWTNAQPNWLAEVVPTVQLAGEFSARETAFRDLEVAYARSRFSLSNSVWTLPDLFLQRADGEARLGFSDDLRTREYQWHIDSRLDPRLAKSLLEASAGQVLDQFHFTTPPLILADLSGRWQEPSSVQFQGRLAATNFTFRGEQCDQLMGQTRFADMSLSFADVLVERGRMQIRVPAGSLDLNQRVVYVTNAICTMPPSLVTKVIGPKVFAALLPYRFPSPPTVRVNGRLPIVNTQDADVRFEVVGDAFGYWKLNTRNISGDVYWHGDALNITNLHATLYGGDLTWHGDVDFSPPVGADLQFEGSVKGADFHQFMSDMGRTTNHLEGSLDAQLTISSANSDDWRSWEGSGRVRLRNGFLWDIPIFGFFSPVMNTIVPGLGSSPLSSGSATFKINQSVVETGNLEVKSAALRLAYTGQVELRGNVNARMHAEILRDAWGVGKLISAALWPISKAFEYKITGTIDRPKSEPVYIPKGFLSAFHPFRTIKRLFSRSTPTSSPAVNETQPGIEVEP